MIIRAGSKLHTGRLNIYGPPVVRPFPEKVKAVEGNPFSLICPVGGFPIHDVIWKKGERFYSSPLRQVTWTKTTAVVDSAYSVHQKLAGLLSPLNKVNYMPDPAYLLLNVKINVITNVFIAKLPNKIYPEVLL